MLEFRILGPLEVARDGDAIPLGGPKQRATLAILLLNANRVVSIDRIADDLYAGSPPVTAVTQVQRQISGLRRAIGPASTIETRPPGYVLQVAPDSVDLGRFEFLVEEAARSDPSRAAELLRDALALWRGAPLADLVDEPFAASAVGRLEEIRLLALERRIDADLELGRHRELVGELEVLHSEELLRERFLAQLMLALYRSGRQADALATFRRARQVLVDELGIEPGRALRELEQGILRQDAALDLDASAPLPSRGERSRSILAVATEEPSVDRLVSLAAPLAALQGRDLIVTRAVEDEEDVAPAAAALNVRRQTAMATRVAAFATRDIAHDVARLVSSYDVDLVLVDAPPELDGEHLPAGLGALFGSSTADIAVVRPGQTDSGEGVFVPFGGGKHDWAAAEVGAWLARATDVQLTLVGTSGEPARGRRDASTLLANAALAVQQVAGVETAPLLAERSEDGLLRATAGARVVVAGVAEQWRRSGVGDSRRALLRRARQTVLLVHGGLRPGGLAPRDSYTRFTWTVESASPYLQAVSFAAR
jgi:DNA-binding SARP family transcriptional activator